MAQAALEDSMSEEATPSIDFIISRNDDPLALALRNGDDLNNDELLQLSQTSSSAPTSVGSSPTAVFSSREHSIVTKPTSYGTAYPAHNYNGEGKVDIMYAASLSATQGSESEAEVELDDTCHVDLLGTGAWSSGPYAYDQCLRRFENAKVRKDTKVRLSKVLPHRLKKPVVVLHQPTQGAATACHDAELHTTVAPPRTEGGPVCLRNHIPRQHYALLAWVGLMILTILLGGRSLYRMDTADIALVRRTALGATVLLASETVITMLVARRTLSEALLLGLFPLITGFMVSSHLDSII